MLFKYCWIKLLVVEIFHSSNIIVCTDFLYQDTLVCYEYLVSGTKYNVSDEQLSASSQYDALHAAKWGRLNTVYVKGKHIGGWAPANIQSSHFIEVRFNELSIIQAIATQGRNITGDSILREDYVTKYQVYHRLDNITVWGPVRAGTGQEPKVFQGNNDSNSIRTNDLPCAVQARFVRIRVNDSSTGYPSMRFDVRGCPVSQVYFSPDCDFENDFCGWKQEYDHESVKWKIESGATPASMLLKLYDHTRKHGNGSFASLKSISPPDGSGRNISAQLVTTIWKSNSTRSLHLWHRRTDPSFGLLSLYLIRCENENEKIAKHLKDLTQEWKHVCLDVSVQDYRLIIEGTVTSEDNGYLAIDDISLMKGYCSDCTFDDGFCHWKNEDNGWKTVVYDSQGYIVITGENKNKSTKANLTGPEVDTGYNSSCLSFSYSMSGDENNSLSVLLLLNETATSEQLYRKAYDGWINAFYEIVNNGEKYRIQFFADVTTGFIGLDNISLIFEPCLKKGNKTSAVSVGVAVGVAVGISVGAGVLGLSILILIGVYIGRRRPFRSSAANTSIKTDFKMAMSNEMYTDTVQEYANVLAGKSESVSRDPTYDNNQGVQSTHQKRAIKEERGYAVVSTPKRQIEQHTQEEQIYDHLDTGEKVPRLDDETYDHVKK